MSSPKLDDHRSENAGIVLHAETTPFPSSESVTIVMILPLRNLDITKQNKKQLQYSPQKCACVTNSNESYKVRDHYLINQTRVQCEDNNIIDIKNSLI